MVRTVRFRQLKEVAPDMQGLKLASHIPVLSVSQVDPISVFNSTEVSADC